MHRYLAELIGTFALVFVGTGAIVVDATTGDLTHVGVSLAFGLIVMAVIYAIGNISGAHINPAVTIGFWAAGRFSRQDLLPYILAQSLGAVAGSGCVRLCCGSEGQLGLTQPRDHLLAAGLLEMLLTALLMGLILNVSRGSRENTLFAGISVGGFIAVAALMGGPISGASLNPARSLGPAVVSGNLTALWLYLLTPVVGVLVAVPVDRLLTPAAGPGDRALEENA